MLKIGQNWGKIENYPPNAQQRFAPLPLIDFILNKLKKDLMASKNSFLRNVIWKIIFKILIYAF